MLQQIGRLILAQQHHQYRAFLRAGEMARQRCDCFLTHCLPPVALRCAEAGGRRWTRAQCLPPRTCGPRPPCRHSCWWWSKAPAEGRRADAASGGSPPSPDRRRGSAGSAGPARPECADIGSASCREREGQYVELSVVAVSFKKKKHTH